MKTKKFLIILLLFTIPNILSACNSILNPTQNNSKLEHATIKGRVTRTFTSGGNTLIEGVPKIMIKTELGRESTYTNQAGYYSLDLAFRYSDENNETKARIIVENPYNPEEPGYGYVHIRDGLILSIPYFRLKIIENKWIYEINEIPNGPLFIHLR